MGYGLMSNILRMSKKSVLFNFTFSAFKLQNNMDIKRLQKILQTHAKSVALTDSK